MSEDTATMEPSYTVNTDAVGAPYIPIQEVVIRFTKNNKGEAGVQKTTSKPKAPATVGKPMFVINVEIVSPEKTKCYVYDEVTMELVQDEISGQPKTTDRIISGLTNTEWWVLGLDSTGKHLKKLLTLCKLPLGANADVSPLADGRLEGRAFKVRFGSKIEVVKDRETKIPTGEKKLRHQIYEFLDVATSDNKIAAVE